MSVEEFHQFFMDDLAATAALAKQAHLEAVD